MPPPPRRHQFVTTCSHDVSADQNTGVEDSANAEDDEFGKTFDYGLSSVAFERFLNRELSRLDFDGRVLELGPDPRCRCSSGRSSARSSRANLDQFFMIRVAGLMNQAASGLAPRSPDGRTPQEALEEIRLRVLELTRRQSKLWKDELVPALEQRGITIVGRRPRRQGSRGSRGPVRARRLPRADAARRRPGQPFPYISGLSLSLGVFVRDPVTEEERFARVKVPEPIPRFLPVGKHERSSRWRP